MLGSKNKTGKTAPVSSHPFFPAVVALWFAALLGLGSLVLPVGLFEKAVTATGLSSLISAAEPPLGTTARIAIAIFSGLAGGVVGLLIARKVTAAQVAATPGRNVFKKSKAGQDADTSSVKPISAHEELGSEGLDEPIADAPDSQDSNAAYRGKRRSLAVTDDSGTSDFLEAAPLPGGEAMIDQHVDDYSADEVEQGAEPEAVIEEPLELAEMAPLEAMDEIANESAGAASEADESTESVAEFSAEPKAAEILLARAEMPHASNDPMAELREELGTMTDNAKAPEPTPYNPFGEQDAPAEPAAGPFAAPAETDSLSFEDEAVGEFAQPVAIAPQMGDIAIQSAAAEHAVPTAVSDKALNDLGMVELVERFAVALRTKADAAAKAYEIAAAEDAAAPLVFQRSGTAAAAPFAPSPAEEAGNAVAEFFSAPSAVAQPAAMAAPEPIPNQAPIMPEATPSPSVPASMQPLGFDDADDDVDDSLSLSLSLNASHQPFTQPVAPTEAEVEAPAPVPNVPQEAFASVDQEPETDDDVQQDGAYSSLLAMKSPFASGQEFVRIEDEDDGEIDGGHAVEPTVVFPGSDRRAAPAADGPTRDPVLEGAPDISAAPRPFDAPGQSPANGPSAAATNANPGETERALREALEKLQRMSGAA